MPSAFSDCAIGPPVEFSLLLLAGLCELSAAMWVAGEAEFPDSVASSGILPCANAITTSCRMSRPAALITIWCTLPVISVLSPSLNGEQSARAFELFARRYVCEKRKKRRGKWRLLQCGVQQEWRESGGFSILILIAGGLSIKKESGSAMKWRSRIPHQWLHEGRHVRRIRHKYDVILSTDDSLLFRPSFCA